jgi:hypothetical protein
MLVYLGMMHLFIPKSIIIRYTRQLERSITKTPKTLGKLNADGGLYGLLGTASEKITSRTIRRFR